MVTMADPAPGVPATWEICRAPGSTAQTDGEHHLRVVGQFGAESANALKTPGEPQSMAMTDCAYCLPHAGAFALPPPHHAGAFLASGRALRPYLFYHAPRPLLALSAAPPRGPPRQS